MLELRNVKVYLNQTSLFHINLNVSQGEVVTIMAPSGAGKSTLLSCIVGQLPVAFSFSGSIVLNEQEITSIPTERRQIGLMFQSPLLFPHMTVAQNIAFGMSESKNERNRWIAQQLTQLGLSGFADRYPNTLSGGQQSKVALLRLLANKPKAVLLDEPFNSLDEENKAHTREWVISTLRQANIPVIMVTHDKNDAHAINSEIVLLENAC